MLSSERVKAISVLWAMTGLSFIFVPLRLYTRIYILGGLKWDDHVFNLGWVFLLLYTVFCTVAGQHGLGKPVHIVGIDDAAQAMYMDLVGQTFAVLGLALANISLGIFLLRIVIKSWHQITIWIAMVSVSVVSILASIVFWIQRSPLKSIYDPNVAGRTIVPVAPFSILLGVWCTVVDFYFALIPWLFIWELNIKFKEKMTIAISLSLGFIAGICGIIRTIELGGLLSTDYTEDSPTLIIWSAVELAVTLICIGIPTVRPLYRRVIPGSSAKNSPESYKRPNENGESARRFEMPMRNSRGYLHKDDMLATTTSVVRDEEMLGAGFHEENSQYADCIRIRQEVRIETT
ncbi:hypothetical protein ETB97_007344 [Aspergillus alliaceus]|uniref:Rhodopsin domain-containing protein n=1 Tax=Petromyces alliaceus TaxID=209559 RepID=A0A5N6FPU7_PETAA|nr:uncharacterized protein BDW43DRAFT_283970 [Aspergillus alliaceus]KAB8230990.1 hypothetical protein BDW43DRAFT_283970 [Aspergillus alliaceus]KAE8385324.1 hypothetical protein BDV23DRAFT_188366 [Aspergillus alliaceus]KAF5864513.1 hypothetical protein ETB97_007344 [Aspergillus burnettii]